MQVLTHFDDFAIGDVVTLKSGGPDMTLTGFELPEVAPQPTGVQMAKTMDVAAAARCHWFLETGSPVSGLFPIMALNIKTKVDDGADKPIAPSPGL